MTDHSSTAPSNVAAGKSPPRATCQVGDVVRKAGSHIQGEVVELHAFSALVRVVDSATGAAQELHVAFGEVFVVCAARSREPIRLLSVDDVLRREPAQAIVDGLLHRGDLAVIYGKPNCGKTFCGIDLSMCVATGRPWANRKVMQGNVLYIVAEGRAGFPKRLRAWAERYARDVKEVCPHMRVVLRPLDLTSADLSELIASIDAANFAPVLIVIDTLAMSMSGDENLAHDMGRLVASCRRLNERFDAAVALVHHANAGGERERGSTALRGAAELMLKVTAKRRIISVICDKQRDEDVGSPLKFRLVPIAVGEETIGRTLTSCYLELVEATNGGNSRGNKVTSAVSVLHALQDSETKLDQAAIAERTGLAKSTVSKALTSHVKAQRVSCEGPRNGQTYAIAGRDYGRVSTSGLVSPGTGNSKPTEFPDTAPLREGGSEKRGDDPASDQRTRGKSRAGGKRRAPRAEGGPSDG